MLNLSKRSESPTLNFSNRSESQKSKLSNQSEAQMMKLSNRSDCPMLNLWKRNDCQMLTRGEPVTCTPSRSKSTIKRREGEVTSSSSILSKSETPTLNLSKRRDSPMLLRRKAVTPFKSENVDISDAERMLRKSTRSLSVSFQGENKAMLKPSPASTSSGSSRVRKGTDESRKLTAVVKDQTENVRICDRNMWHGRLKAMNSPNLARSLDYGNDKSKLFGSGNRIRDSQNSVISNTSKTKGETRFKSDSVNSEVICKAQCVEEINSVSISDKSTVSGVLGSDNTSSGLSGSTLGGSVVKARGGRRDIVVPARFLQETNSRRRMEREIASGPSMPIGTKKYLLEIPVLVHGRFASPIRGETKLAFISKGLWTPMNCSSPRGRPSPAKSRNGTPKCSHDNAAPSVLSFNADIRRVAGGENRVEDAHELRILHNRQLQWRFINARAEAALLAQSGTAERNLYNASVAISKLQHSIESKRSRLQLLRQNLNLYSILKGQLPYLESWALIDQDHCILLSEVVQALQTNIANLPLPDGAKANIELVKKAICSAADVMQGVTSSVGSHMAMVEQVSLLTSELANTTANEIDLIDQGKNLLSEFATLQVNDCSLKAHVLQLPH
ncbi:hypothetical protein LIER_22001 [Lithospermum erythrorhizon]|uniref:Uncharacterized protein n=1 Tax=Lithospermum erythrorhizon TaxID=34254 RepID=A0AAV3QSE9_LITER